MKKEEIQSSLFKLNRTRCFLLMMLHHKPGLSIALTIVLVVGVAIAFCIDIAVGLACMGISFFMMVMYLSFIIMVYGFYSVTGYNTQMHKVAVSDYKVTVTLEDGTEHNIEKQDFLPYKIYPGGLLIPTRGAKSGWLWLPPRAFENENEFKEFINNIYD